ncbi:MAG: hypothetical protein EXS15_02930 [Phycisphaerales bacterium]|nr:hypothetical protein [Phycisphaerales bacterium]
MTNHMDQLDEPLHFGRALMSWILPGLGQCMAGHRRRGIFAMIAILGMFFCGLLIGGVDSVDRKEDPLWFYAQAAAGPIAFAADWANSGLLKTGRVGELVESPPSNPRAAPTMVSTFKTVTVANEVGILYCALAGLMNVVVVLDALKRPSALAQGGWKGS